MFKHEGPARSSRKNAMLAGYLALVAGFVNSGGFVLIGTLTSHVTGSVGRASIDYAEGRPAAGVAAMLLVISFFTGAFLSSLIVETAALKTMARAYGIALLIEAILLAAFVSIAGLSQATHPRALDAEAAILCLAMGMQNSLVTRLSGAVIRTTHLTGVVTDLAIETARWYRWHRAKLSRLPELIPMRSKATRPSVSRALILMTIIVAFAIGSAAGALLTLRASRWAMLAPAALVLFAAIYAFLEREESPAAPTTTTT